MRPDFSIITPSFQQAGWLKLCAASIADQEGVQVEHIVQDAGTGPEFETWAAGRPGLALHVERDRGMYDAINRGLRKASGEFGAESLGKLGPFPEKNCSACYTGGSCINSRHLRPGRDACRNPPERLTPHASRRRQCS